MLFKQHTRLHCYRATLLRGFSAECGPYEIGATEHIARISIKWCYRAHCWQCKGCQSQMTALQTQMTALQGQMTALQTQMTALQGSASPHKRQRTSSAPALPPAPKSPPSASTAQFPDALLQSAPPPVPSSDGGDDGTHDLCPRCGKEGYLPDWLSGTECLECYNEH